MCVWAKETNGDQSNDHKNTLINLTNKSLLIGWPDENEPCPTPFVKLLLKCDEYVVDVIARLDDDFWTVCAWMTWRAPPFDVIVCRMFICLCCEWIPSDVWMFCDKLCKKKQKKGENERRCKKKEKGIMQFAKHVKQELVGDFQKRQFWEEFRDTKSREIGRERDLKAELALARNCCKWGRGFFFDRLTLLFKRGCTHVMSCWISVLIFEKIRFLNQRK